MTDHDEISPTNAKHEETLKAFQVLLGVFCRDDQTFSLIGGALPFEERDVGMLDLLSATDICAGALAEYLTQREMRDADKIAIKPGCEHVLQCVPIRLTHTPTTCSVAVIENSGTSDLEGIVEFECRIIHK